MSNVTQIPTPELSIREAAEAEVRAEQAKGNKEKMKKLLRDKIAAEQVLKGIDMQIADLEQQIIDGTI